MNNDFYIVLQSTLSGETYVWENSVTDNYQNARKSNDGQFFIVKYTDFFSIPQQLIFNMIFSYVAILEFLKNNADNWEPPEE